MTAAENGLTIADAPRQRSLRVLGVTGSPRLVHRLASIGVVPGADIKVMRQAAVTVVAIGDGRIALGPTAATAVMVEEVNA